jgi:hypothetical protein
MGRKLSAMLLVRSLNQVMDSSGKPRRWYERLCEYKKAELVRTGLRRRVFAEIYQMLKKGEYHYGRDPVNHGMKMAHYRRFLEKQKKEILLQKKRLIFIIDARDNFVPLRGGT